MTHPIPTAAQDDRLGFLGTSGSGKTYCAGTVVERLLAKKARVVTVDPLGVWWGLRLTADGKRASPFNVVIFGGPRGDLPLTEHAGALIGETAATMTESCIIDLRELGSKAAERRFMTAFLDAIYRKATGEPFHLVVDEADLFAPQKPAGGDETLLGHMENIVRRGRVKGFIPWLISQRPAVLNKNVLSQVDGLVAFKLTSSQDREALDSWIEGQADKAQGRAIKDALPTMEIGQGVVWLPGHGLLKTAKFPQKETFDSSRTPKRGEKLKRTATLKPLNLGALKDQLAAVEQEAKASDPKKLRAEIAGLKAERDKLQKQVDSAKDAEPVKAPSDKDAIKAAEKKGFEQARKKLENASKRALIKSKREALTTVAGELKKFAGIIAESITNFEADDRALEIEFAPTVQAPAPNPVHAHVPRSPINTSPRVTALVNRAVQDGALKNVGTTLPPGERAILIAAVQYEGVDRDQLSVLTGYKRSSRDAYIQRLREKGYVEVSGQRVVPTDNGRIALGSDCAPLPTGEGLQQFWNAKLPEGERKILGALISAYPADVQRADLDDLTGYKRSSRDAYIQRLKARRLLTTEGSAVRASDTLF